MLLLAAALAVGLAPVPGAVDPAVTQENIHATICVSGYAASVRPRAAYTNALKRKQMAALGLIGSTSQYEEDHLIPLALGGDPMSPLNLWPEPRFGQWNARAKDRLESKLHYLVCRGGLPLARAQAVFAQNWIAGYGQYIGGTPSTEIPSQRYKHHRKRKHRWPF